MEKEANLKNGSENKRRVLWFSNAPWHASGYGSQTSLFLSHLIGYGHEIAVCANSGLEGTKLEIGGVKIYPKGSDAYSNDVVQGYANDWKAEVTISLYDAWPLIFGQMPTHETPWVAWLPIDHEGVPNAVAASLRFAQGIVAMSKHGQQALIANGFDAHYIPHGVATNIFKPMSQADAREKLELPKDDFIVGMVANNAFFPSRKCFPQVIDAFSRLHEKYSDTHLYLHTRIDQAKQGLNLPLLIDRLGLTGKVSMAHQLDYHMGYPVPIMVEMYATLDVLANPSMGEGFGIPIIEAQACGVPVIGANNTSMPELVTGWLAEGERWYTEQDHFRHLPSVQSIFECMEKAYLLKREHDEIEHEMEATWLDLQAQCRTKALEYDYAKVVAPMWNEYLETEPWEKMTPIKQQLCLCVEVTAGNDERRQYIPGECPIHKERWEGDFIHLQKPTAEAVEKDKNPFDGLV